MKKAATIPWPAIEKRYAALFTNPKGNVAKPLRLGLGACIIQEEYHYSDVETTLQIQESPYLQYFCGYKAYDDSNGGAMIVDATCAPSQIKYPQDAAPLNEARESTEALIDALHTPGAWSGASLWQSGAAVLA